MGCRPARREEDMTACDGVNDGYGDVGADGDGAMPVWKKRCIPVLKEWQKKNLFARLPKLSVTLNIFS